MDENLIEKQVESTLLYSGNVFNLHKDKVLLPNKAYAYREYITHPKAVVVVPLFSNGDILLVKQFRYALKKIFIEVPAGKVEEGENLEKAALRELLEETGYEAGKISWLCQVYPCIGYSNEEMHLYRAEDLTEKEQATDDDEFIQPMRVSFDEMVQLLNSGKITDLKTMVSLYAIQKYIKNQV